MGVAREGFGEGAADLCLPRRHDRLGKHIDKPGVGAVGGDVAGSDDERVEHPAVFAAATQLDDLDVLRGNQSFEAVVAFRVQIEDPAARHVSLVEEVLQQHRLPGPEGSEDQDCRWAGSAARFGQVKQHWCRCTGDGVAEVET